MCYTQALVQLLAEQVGLPYFRYYTAAIILINEKVRENYVSNMRNKRKIKIPNSNDPWAH
jgi:hypothetical protein